MYQLSNQTYRFQLKLGKYDVVLKWRTDLPKVSGRVRMFLDEFTNKYDNFKMCACTSNLKYNNPLIQ